MTQGGWAAKLAATLAGRPATMRVGGQSEVGRLLSVAIKPAGDAFQSAAAVDRQWRDLGYTAPPELGAASPPLRRRRCARPACRFAAASPATAASRAETSAGSTSARWRWAGVTEPTMRGSASCETWWRDAWTR